MALTEPTTLSIDDAVEKFDSIAGNKYGTTGKARNYRRVVLTNSSNEVAGFARYAHYEFRIEGKHGIEVQFHIESEEYGWLAEYLKSYARKPNGINCEKVDFDPDWKGGLGRLRVTPKAQTSECVASTMLDLIEATRT